MTSKHRFSSDESALRVGVNNGLLNDRVWKVEHAILAPGKRGLPLHRTLRRAKDSLRVGDECSTTAPQALTQLLIKWPRAGQAIEHVRPYQFLRRQRKPEGGELRILLCWTANDAHGRGLLWDLGPSIAAEIGWYPMVIGPWRSVGSNAVVKLARSAQRAPAELAWPLGDLASIRDLTYGKGSESGVAFALQTSEAQFVFDLGMDEANPDLVEAVASASLILVSHAHRDHAGALAIVLERSTAPILMTEATLLQLLTIHLDLNAAVVKALLERTLVCASDAELRFPDGGTLNLWPANHGPGSVCCLLSTSDGRTLLYTGDFSITSAYGDGVLHAIRGIRSKPMPRQLDWAIVDGTFLGRKLETAAESAYFTDFVRQTIDAGRCGLVIANDSDIALLLYFELFRLVMGQNKRAEVQAYLGPHTVSLLSLVASAYLSGRLQDMDPELRELWRRRQDPFESHQLWDIDHRVLENVRFQQLLGERVFLFVTPDELATAKESLTEAIRLLAKKRIDSVVVGKATQRPELKTFLRGGALEVGGTEVPLRGAVGLMADEMWLLHSAPEDLFAWVTGEYGQQIGQVRFFHNFPGRVRRALREVVPPHTALPVQRVESLTDALNVTDPK